MARLILRRPRPQAPQEAPQAAPDAPRTRAGPSSPVEVWGHTWDAAYRHYVNGPQEIRDDMSPLEYAQAWHRVSDRFRDMEGRDRRLPYTDYTGALCLCPACTMTASEEIRDRDTSELYGDMRFNAKPMTRDEKWELAGQISIWGGILFLIIYNTFF